MSARRIDSHQHFWQLARGDYDWLSPSLTAIYRDFTPDRLKPLLDENGVEKTIVVQAAATVAETEYLLRLADEYPWIAGVVGWVDMTAGEAAIKTLERLQGAGRFVGIRPMIQDIPDPDWMLQARLTPVFEWLEAQQLTFDALVGPGHLPNLLQLLRRHPRLKAVIDHGGKPAIRDNAFDEWADDIKRLAGETAVRCKLSGLLTEAKPGAGYVELGPYIDHLLACFGASRLLWGSDWPVVNLAADYGRWIALSDQALEPLPESDRQKIRRDNAEAFYLQSSQGGAE